MVIGPNQDEQLAPFSEQIDVPKYSRGLVSDEEKQRFIDYYTKEKGSTGTFDELVEKHGKEWNGGCWEKNSDGEWEEFSTYNPKSKWDWYEVGGRWAGSIKLKEGVKPLQAVNFPWGWDEAEKKDVLSENRADVAYKRDIANLDELDSFAILKDGEWIEQGQMGWFGMARNEKPDDEWNSQVKSLLESLPDDTLISIYDCHI